MDTNEHETTELTPAADEPTKRPPNGNGFHRRTAAIVAGGIAALLVAFLLGVGTGKHHDGHGDDRFERSGGGMPFGRGGDDGPGSRGRGPDGMRGGGPGDKEGGRGMGGPGGGGPGGGPGGGTMGVVESTGDGTLTISALRGDSGTVKVTLSDDTEVSTRGDNGPEDIEDAKAGDIGKGDIVAVRADKDDADDDKADEGDDTTIAASHVIILYDADA